MNSSKANFLHLGSSKAYRTALLSTEEEIERIINL